jgi:phosphoribosyl 1,2-cyclic phosphodiesterase
MALLFSTLASGSQGNAALIQLNQKNLLIDAGISARVLQKRLAMIGLRVSDLTEAILTHTHSDHANGTAMQALADHQIPFRCHPSHEQQLSAREGFLSLKENGLVLHYGDNSFLSAVGVEIAPVRLQHGAGLTFGFRINHRLSRSGMVGSIAYFADLGCWNDQLVDHFSGCGLLAMEFNHDVAMTRESGRHPMIIARNLSDDGHLSNDQASSMLKSIIKYSCGLVPGHLVLLHISHECNTAELALTSARNAINEITTEFVSIHAAQQNVPLEWLAVSYHKDHPSKSETHSLPVIKEAVKPISKPIRARFRAAPNQLEFAFPA